jgi:ketosteroid isomerase-like protein
MTSNNEPTAIMATYFDCWRKGDLATLRTILADDFSFRGPLGQVDNAEDGVQAMRGLAQMTTDIVVRKVFSDGPDVLTWFELHTKAAPPCPVANWSHVDDGKIARIRATFDPRPLLGG